MLADYKYEYLCLLLAFHVHCPIGHCGILQVQVATLGTISPSATTVSLIYLMPPIDFALQELRARYGTLFNLTHTYIYDKQRPMTCAEMIPNSDFMLAEWYYKRKSVADLDAFISPSCAESDNVNRLTAGWNMLMLTSVATGRAFGNKTISPTRVTTAPTSITNFSKLLQNLLKQFQWKTIYMVINGTGDGFYGSFALEAGAVIKRIPDSQLQLVRLNVTVDQSDYLSVLQHFRTTSRVFFFLGFAVFFRRFLKGHDQFTWQSRDQDDEIAREAFRSVLVLANDDSVYALPSPEACATWVNQTRSMFNVTVDPKDLILSETIITDPSFDWSNGKKLAALFFNRTYALNFSDMYISSAGERSTRLVIKDLDRVSGIFKTVLYQDHLNLELHLVTDNKTVIDWGGSRADNVVPLNKPLCGYHGDQGPCSYQGNVGQVYVTAFSTALTCLLVGSAMVFFWIRKYVAAAQHHRWWLLNADGLVLDGHLGQLQQEKESKISVNKINANFSKRKSPVSVPNHGQKAIYFNGEVWVDSYSLPIDSPLNAQRLSTKTLPLRVIALFKELRNQPHLNINAFQGLCLFPSTDSIHFVSNYCQRGSLHDLFERFSLLDIELTSSLVNDLLHGIQYIHSSALGFHGDLSGWNCLIDNRFTLRISRLGYRELKSALLEEEDCVTSRPHNKLYWTAPEILRGEARTSKLTDIYSAGVILYQIITASQPTFTLLLQTGLKSPKDIIREIGLARKEPIRADIDALQPGSLFELSWDAQKIISLCWNEVATVRPSIQQVQEIFGKEFPRHRASNLVEGLLKRLDEYACGLEEQVYLRTIDLKTEQAKCEKLLLEMLPLLIIRKLRNGEAVLPEMFESVTLMFSDIVGFAQFAASHNPLQITNLLDTVYSIFDPLVEEVDAYKVETTGDVYMVASGVPVCNGMKHVKEICCLALSLHAAFRRSTASTEELAFMAGIHSGACAAGVMGQRNPRYCLFGDSVNTASRIATHSLPDKIHMSHAAAQLLEIFPGFLLTERGSIEIKGKGRQTTFWLEDATMASNEKLAMVMEI